MMNGLDSSLGPLRVCKLLQHGTAILTPMRSAADPHQSPRKTRKYFSSLGSSIARGSSSGSSGSSGSSSSGGSSGAFFSADLRSRTLSSNTAPQDCAAQPVTVSERMTPHRHNLLRPLLTATTSSSCACSTAGSSLLPSLSQRKSRRHRHGSSLLINVLPAWEDLPITPITPMPLPDTTIGDILMRGKQRRRVRQWQILLVASQFTSKLATLHQQRNNASATIARCWCRHVSRLKSLRRTLDVASVSRYYDEVEASFTAPWMTEKVKRAYERVPRRHGWIYPCSRCASNTWRIAYGPHTIASSKMYPSVYLCKDCFCRPEYSHFVRSVRKHESLHQEREEQEDRALQLEKEKKDGPATLRRSQSLDRMLQQAQKVLRGGKNRRPKVVVTRRRRRSLPLKGGMFGPWEVSKFDDDV